MVEDLLRGFSEENFGDRDGNYFPIVHGPTQDVKLFRVSTKNREYFMESALYGIYARVADVSEIERVSAANE